MDWITHGSVAPLLLQGTGTSRPKRALLLCAAAGGLFPDVDFLLGLVGPDFSLRYHRSWTHSLLLAPAWALLLALVARRAARANSLAGLFAAFSAGILSHIGLDLLTSWGTMIFSPVSYHRFALPLLRIVTPAVTLIVLAGLGASLALDRKHRERGARLAALTGLALLSTYFAFAALFREQALRRWELALPEPAVRIVGYPTAQPLVWRTRAESASRFFAGQVNLATGEVSLSLAQEKPAETPYVAAADRLAVARFYREFVRFARVTTELQNGRILVRYRNFASSGPSRSPFDSGLDIELAEDGTPLSARLMGVEVDVEPLGAHFSAPADSVRASP